jgi:sterol desaturase/sphingolipid hydroxylase (fatty acid hydroxylase superfamily)
MSHLPVDHSEDAVRLFKSNFLEFFTHISPITVLVIWLPVAVYFMVRGILASPAASRWFIPAGFLVGLFLWTITEYTLHRFLFHFRARNPLQERLLFLFHGVHHAQPQAKTRLVMPPVLSIPLALIFLGLFYLIFSAIPGAGHWLYPTFSGFIGGYLIYDITHYATHHFPMRSGYLKFIKRYHMQHHYKTPNARFGVSSPLWDYVFNTHPD